MITVACTKCLMTVRTTGDMAELRSLFIDSEWYPSNYPCPRAGCDGRGEYMQTIDPTVFAQLEIHDLTPAEMFAALNGLGLPEEHDCGATAVELAFQKQVKRVSVRQVNKLNRSIIDFIEFEDGSRMFFGSSPLGPIVYRISKPHSYTEAALG